MNISSTFALILYLLLPLIFTEPSIRVYHGYYKISDDEIESAFVATKSLVSERSKLEDELIRKGKTVTPRTADTSLLQKKADLRYVHQCEGHQLPFQVVTANLTKKYNIPQGEINQALSSHQLRGPYSSTLWKECRDQIGITDVCDPQSKYRTFDGSCNNLQNPAWGMANACFRRLFTAHYTGESGFRQSVLGGPLPDPRILSRNIHNNRNRPTNYISHLFMFFGQLLAHDITFTPISTFGNNRSILCCPPEENDHPQCAPILIPSNDPFYSQFGRTCLNFVRSAICPTCTLGTRQQMNQVTAFIDASFLYGSSYEEGRNLRANDGTGQLRSERSFSAGELLPTSFDPVNDECSFVNTSEICFQSGDPRVNQHTTLAALHTLFLREHNRIASGLQVVNPHWDDERTFQEARRIVGAEMQTIVFKEWLPSVLGSEKMSELDLWITPRRWTRYDPNADPTLYNEFSTAAFRFGHSLINSLISISFNAFRNDFFQPFQLRNRAIGPLLQGALATPAQYFDRYLVDDVTNYLYRIRNESSGLDLAAFNIQRGRDHGMPPYAHVVEWCSNGEVVLRRFGDLVDNLLMGYDNMNLLRQNYRDVRDIDLWTGILSETYNQGAVVGPTANCIIRRQFHQLKFGDRFYFENGFQAGAFTYEQVEELRRTTLSQIICANTEATEIPVNAMLFRSRNNPIIYCRYSRPVDASYWREK